MIEPVLNYANTHIQDLAIFKDVKGLCEMVKEIQSDGQQDFEIKYPAIYSGNDTLRQVTNNDFKQGAAFHINNGDVSETDLERIRVRSRYIERRYPVKLIAIIKRSAYNTDSPYSPDELANNLMSQLSRLNITSLRSELGADKVSIDVRSASTNKENILESTFINVEFPPRHDLMVVSVDYEIVVTGNEDCLLTKRCN